MTSVDPGSDLGMQERRSPGKEEADSMHRTKQRNSETGQWV